MAAKLLSPYCVTQSQDPDVFTWIRDFFDAPLAQHHRLKAVAQRYTVKVGHATPVGAPVLLTADPVTGKIPTLASAMSGQVPGVPEDDAAFLISCLTVCNPDRFLNGDIPMVSAPAVWRFILPGMIILQAEEAADLIRQIKLLVDTKMVATWARCALALVRMGPPGSAHEQIHMLGEIRRAMHLMEAARPDPTLDFITWHDAEITREMEEEDLEDEDDLD